MKLRILGPPFLQSGLIPGRRYSWMRRIITTLVGVLTLLANTLESPTAFLQAGVRLVIGMALRTMRFVHVVVAPGKVLTLSYRVKMFGVDASRYLAQMVKNKAVWNRAYQQFIGKPVDQYFRSGRTFNPASNADRPIPMIADSSGPNPTFIRTTLLNFRPETVCQRFRAWPLRYQTGFPI